VEEVFTLSAELHAVNEFRQKETHTAEPLVLEPSASEVELAIQNYKVSNHQGLMKYQRNCLRLYVD
jgi:hypothetical protein